MKSLIPQLGRSLKWLLAIILVSTFIAVVVDWRAPGLSRYLQDVLMRMRGTMPPPDQIVILAIDDASIARFGRFPWSRALTAQALEKISAANPKVIGLSVLYSEATNENDDVALAQAIKNSGKVVVAAQLVSIGANRAEWLRPLPDIEQAAAAVGHGNVATDNDGVARALLLREADDGGHTYWSLAAELVRVADGARPEEIHEVPGAVRIAARTIPVVTDSQSVFVTTQPNSTQFETVRANRMPIDFVGPAGTFAARTFSLADLMDGRVTADDLRGKYVLVGATASAMGDRVASPFSRYESKDGAQNGQMMPGVEVLANAVTTILRERFYVETPGWLAALVAALIAAAIVFWISAPRENLSMMPYLLFVGILLVGILLVAFAMFAYGLVLPPLVPAIVSAVVAIPLTLFRRAMSLSTNLNERFAELIQESGKLSPTAMDFGDEAATDSTKQFWLSGTSRKMRALEKLQRQLMARSQFVDSALRSIEDSLLIADTNGRIVFANPRASQILRMTGQGVIGQNLFACLKAVEFGSPAADEMVASGLADQTLSRLLNDRQSVEREIVIGEIQPRTYTLRMNAVFAADGNLPLGIVTTLYDITKERELLQMKNDVLALVTHEMRTPLTAIKGMSEILLQFDTTGERRREMHQTINEAAERLSRMIDEYLDLSRLESGARPLMPNTVQPAALVEQTLLLLDPVAAQRGIKLTRRLAEDLPMIFVDEDLLSRALTNLVANAIKYSPANTEVVISADTDDKSLFISVADRGYGIPPALLSRIFEKFYRVPRVEDADAPGTGLGLALVREIAELHDGRVMVESEPGSGSVFTLRLPIEFKRRKHHGNIVEFPAKHFSGR
ncbi:MAG: CHASE2 domain-containing protein [Acidobacteriota bacterium]|nr:CHASE2 domain-containing protein [Acidobacteriota bacterium]